MNRTEGKIEELRKITKETQLAFHELASRVINSVQEKRIQDNQDIQLIETTIRKLFAEHISGTVASPDSLIIGGDVSVEKQPLLNNRLSELDQRLADLFNTPSASTSRGFVDEAVSEMEKASKYKAWLGEVYMRTVAMRYTSAGQISDAAFPEWSSLISEPIKFPATVTRTEILLLPRTWGRNRGGTITCNRISGTSSEASDISFEIHTFNSDHGANDRNQYNSPYMNGVSSMEMSRPDQLKKNISDTSQSLLFTAFRAGFIAINACKSGKIKTKELSLETPLPRSSFDEEINDILELVHLWLSSGLEADFYKDAFPSDTTAIKQRSESVFNAVNRRTVSLERLRHEYILRLILEIMAKCSGGNWLEGKDLYAIHQNHWERCQHIVLSSTLDTKIQPSHVYEECFDSPIFVAACEGNTATLRHHLGLRLTSPFVRTTSGISLLESAAISVFHELESWWYDDIPFEHIAVRGKGQDILLREQWHLVANRKSTLDHVYREQRLRNLFDMIEFLISLGLKLAGSLWDLIQRRLYKAETINSPNWYKRLLKGIHGKSDTDSWINQSFRSNIGTFRYYLQRACAEEEYDGFERNMIKILKDSEERPCFYPEKCFSWFRIVNLDVSQHLSLYNCWTSIHLECFGGSCASSEPLHKLLELNYAKEKATMRPPLLVLLPAIH